MMLPDCRRDDYYNEDFLNPDDRKFINGYDWGVEGCADSFFDQFVEDLGDNDYLAKKLNETVPESMKEKYEVFGQYFDDADVREVNTYLDFMKMKFREWMEDARDLLITGMIDNMDDEEYRKIREDVLKRNEKSENPKEYCDTRALYQGTQEEEDDIDGFDLDDVEDFE